MKKKRFVIELDKRVRSGRTLVEAVSDAMWVAEVRWGELPCRLRRDKLSRVRANAAVAEVIAFLDRRRLEDL